MHFRDYEVQLLLMEPPMTKVERRRIDAILEAERQHPLLSNVAASLIRLVLRLNPSALVPD